LKGINAPACGGSFFLKRAVTDIREELYKVLYPLPEVSLEAVLEYAGLTEEQELFKNVLFMNIRDWLEKILDTWSEETLEGALWYACQPWFVEFAEEERQVMQKYRIKKPSPKLKKLLREKLWLKMVIFEANRAQGKI
jgi:hypothetical protein